MVLGFMGFKLGPPASDAPAPDARHLRVACFNMQGGNCNAEALRAWIDRTAPDIISFEEPSAATLDRCLPNDEWHRFEAWDLTVASRHPIAGGAKLDKEGRSNPGAACLVTVDTPLGVVTAGAVHLSTARDYLEALVRPTRMLFEVFERNRSLRDERSQAISRWMRESESPCDVVLGDFNLPPESAIFKRDWTWRRRAFSEAGAGFGHTWHSSWHGAAIDHVLISKRWSAAACWVGPDLGSDHRPLVADLIEQSAE